MPSDEEMDKGVIFTNEVKKVDNESYIFKNKVLYSYNIKSKEILKLKDNQILIRFNRYLKMIK